MPTDTAAPESSLPPPQSEAGSSRPARRRASVWRRIARMAWLYVGIHLAFCAMLAWQTVRPKNARITDSPKSSKLPFESVSLVSSDGTRLSGWLIPASGKSRGVVIMCHGVDSNRTAMLWKSEVLHKAGFASLLFDFRGRGESGPSLCTIGYREVDDLLAAIRYVRSRPDYAVMPLGVLGESQGAAVALMGTARSPEVRAVIAESPFARLDHAVDNHFRKVLGWTSPAFVLPTRLVGEALIRRRCCDVSPVDEVSRIAPRPILLIQDAEDRLCPPEETAMLLRAAGKNASLWTVAGADHICAEYIQQDEYERRIVQFFENNL
jgi:uncharacterized protein